MGQGTSDEISGVIWITVWILWIQAFLKENNKIKEGWRGGVILSFRYE